MSTEPTTDADESGATATEANAGTGQPETAMSDELQGAADGNGVVEMDPRAAGGAAASGLFPRISGGGAAAQNDIDMVMEIPVELTVELGRTKVPIGNVLQLAHGSVIELDALASEPMDVYVNGLLIAQGEVVIVNDKFGLRLTDVVTQAERMRRLGKR